MGTVPRNTFKLFWGLEVQSILVENTNAYVRYKEVWYKNYQEGLSAEENLEEEVAKTSSLSSTTEGIIADVSSIGKSTNCAAAWLKLQFGPMQ